MERDRSWLGKPVGACSGLGHALFAPYYIARPVSRQRDLRPPTHWTPSTRHRSHLRTFSANGDPRGNQSPGKPDTGAERSRGVSGCQVAADASLNPVPRGTIIEDPEPI